MSRRRQQALIAVAGTTRFGAGILMGTAMAVYVGRDGSAFAVSMVLTAYFLGMTVFAPVWGAVADVTGRRRAVLVVTGLLSTAAVLPLTVVDGVWGPIGLRAVYAVFAVGFQPVMLAVVSEMGGDDARGRSIGFFNSTRGAGFAGGQALAGVLLGLLAPAEVYLAIAAFSLVGTAAAAVVAGRHRRSGRSGDGGSETTTPDPVEIDAGPAADSGATAAADHDGRDAAPGATATAVLGEVRRRLLPAVGDRSHLRRNGLRWLYVALALRNMTVLGVISLMPVYLTGPVLTDDLSLAGLALSPEATMGLLLAINPTGQAVFMYLFGRVADGLGRKPLIVAGMAGSALFAVVQAGALLPATPWGRIAVAGGGMVVIAAAFSAMTTGALAFIGDVAPDGRESELMGLRSTAKGVGGVLGPPLTGGVATLVGTEAAFGAVSVLAFGAAGLAAGGLVESRGPATRSAAAPTDD